MQNDQLEWAKSNRSREGVKFLLDWQQPAQSMARCRTFKNYSRTTLVLPSFVRINLLTMRINPSPPPSGVILSGDPHPQQLLVPFSGP